MWSETTPGHPLPLIAAIFDGDDVVDNCRPEIEVMFCGLKTPRVIRRASHQDHSPASTVSANSTPRAARQVVLLHREAWRSIVIR